MALATVSDVLEDTGVTYSDFGFSTDLLFQTWISKKISFVDTKIHNMVGTYYTDSDAIPDLKQAEIYWTYSNMLRRRQSMHASSVESGFAIASLRIDSAGKATEDTKMISDDYFKKAQILLDPYTSYSGLPYIIVEDEDE